MLLFLYDVIPCPHTANRFRREVALFNVDILFVCSPERAAKLQDYCTWAQQIYARNKNRHRRAKVTLLLVWVVDIGLLTILGAWQVTAVDL